MSKSTTVMIDKQHRDMLKEVAEHNNRKMVEHLHQMIEEEYRDLHGGIIGVLENELKNADSTYEIEQTIHRIAHKLGINLD